MTLAKKLFFLSAIALIGSICLLNFVDFHQYTDEILKLRMFIFGVTVKMNTILESIGIRGFHRMVENGMSNFDFYLANKTGVNINVQHFEGVEVYLFEPIVRNPNGPAIVHYHGGGWIYSNPKFCSDYLAEMSRRLNLLIVSVNYRKAPEYRFPTGVNDAIRATKYFLKNAEQFGVDPNRIALMGESAGGNFVLVVGYHLAALGKLDKILRTPKILIPIIPTLQMADLNLPSLRDDSRDKILKKPAFMTMICLYALGQVDPKEIQQCEGLLSSNSHLDKATLDQVTENVDWRKYLSGKEYLNVEKSSFSHESNPITVKFSNLIKDPLFSPLSALNNAELSLLPPVVTIAASKDPLRDDARLLASRLTTIGHRNHYKEFDQSHAEFIIAGVKSQQFDHFFQYLSGVLNRKSS